MSRSGIGVLIPIITCAKHSALPTPRIHPQGSGKYLGKVAPRSLSEDPESVVFIWAINFR